MSRFPDKSFWEKYKIFILAAAVAAFLLAFASFSSNEIANMEDARPVPGNIVPVKP